MDYCQEGLARGQTQTQAAAQFKGFNWPAAADRAIEQQT